MSQQLRLTVFGAVASVAALFYLEASMDNHCYSPLSYRVKGWDSDELESEDYFRILSQYYDELKHRDNFISLAYSKRLECIGDAYSNMLKMIPPRIRPKLIEQVSRFKPFRWRMTKVISWVMFSLLFFLNSLMLIVELSEFIYRGGLT